MNVNFNSSEGSNVPIVFETITKRAMGGRRVKNPSYDVQVGTALGYDSSNILNPIKAYRVVENATATATAIKIAKGSGVAVGDFVGNGKVAHKCTAITTTNTDYDTITLNTAIGKADKGKVLYQAKAESTENAEAEPIYQPMYLAGDIVYKDKGDQLIDVINGANVRKEIAPLSEDIAVLMGGVDLV